MATIRMDLAEAEHMISVFTASHAALEDGLRALEAAVTDLEGQWTGSSRQTFVAAWEGWQQGYRQCLDVLPPLINGVQREKEELEQADSSSAYA